MHIRWAWREKKHHVRFDASMQNKREHHKQLSTGSCLGTKLRGERVENVYSVASLLAAGLRRYYGLFTGEGRRRTKPLVQRRCGTISMEATGCGLQKRMDISTAEEQSPYG